MSITASARPLEAAFHGPRLQRSMERLRGALLWLAGFCGAFVFMEPSPYEVAALLVISTFVLTGFTLRPALMPLILMLIVYDIGFAIAALQVIEQQKAIVWMIVSWYLTATTVFFAAMLGTNTEERMHLLAQGYMAGAIIAATVAILAYFQLFGERSAMFMKYDRAAGTFNDPNVLGAFLIFPALLLLHRILAANAAQALRACLLLAVVVTAILLTFSRAAWGQFVGTSALFMGLVFITGRSGRARVRIATIAVLGVIAIVLFIAALLSIDRVAEMFQLRASLGQDYDVAHLGRFGRYWLGALLALDNPFGIGPLQFAQRFPEDPHNAFLNTFLSGGWLSGSAYLALIVTTLVMGLRTIFVATPWRPMYLAVFCAFVGTVFEGAIIDTDHWRHFFLLFGALWGLMIASRPYRRRTATGPMPAQAATRQTAHSAA